MLLPQLKFEGSQKEPGENIKKLLAEVNLMYAQLQVNVSTMESTLKTAGLQAAEM